MSQSGYTPWAVTAGEVPTTAYWNILGANDASFNSGTGINDGAIGSRQIAAHAISNLTYVYNEAVGGVSGGVQTIGQTWTTSANWGAGTVTTTGGDVIFHVDFSAWRATSGAIGQFRIVLNGSSYWPSSTGWQFYYNEYSSHRSFHRDIWVTGLAAGTYTVGLQMLAQSSGTINTDTADWLTILAEELMR